MSHTAQSRHLTLSEFTPQHANLGQKQPSPLPSQHAPTRNLDKNGWAGHESELSTAGSSWRQDAPARVDSTRTCHSLYRSSEPDDWRCMGTRDSATDTYFRPSAAPSPATAKPASRLSPKNGPLTDVSNSKADSNSRMPYQFNCPSRFAPFDDAPGKQRVSSCNIYAYQAQENRAPSRPNEAFAISSTAWANKAQTCKPSRRAPATTGLGASLFSPPTAPGTADASTFAAFSRPLPQSDVGALGAITSPLQSMTLGARHGQPSQVPSRSCRDIQPFHPSFLPHPWAPQSGHPVARVDSPASPTSFNVPSPPSHHAGFVDFATRDAAMNGLSVSTMTPMTSVTDSPMSPRGLESSKYASRSFDVQGQWPNVHEPQGSRSWDEHQRMGAQTVPFRNGAEQFSSLPYGFHSEYSVHSVSAFPSSHQSSPYSPYFAPPHTPEHEMEPTTSLRSTCLAEFRNTNKGTRRWELKDIYDYVVEFSGDHHGSLFIQSKLEKAKSEEKDRIFREIQPNAVPLMKDVFGNYVLQKFFEHGDHLQKKTLVASMRGQVPELSKHVYGCRVVQTALDHILVEQQAALVHELETCVMDCVKNENGNHVIQVAIKVVPMQHLQFMIDQLYGQIQYLATHRYGCRVIQRLLEHCHPPVLTRILQELHECSAHLIADQYGNYVPQHILERGDTLDRNRIIEVVQQNLVAYSKQKFASNVVEKCVKYGTDEQRRQIMLQLLDHDERGGGELLCFLIRDGYGNYVVQSLLDNLNDADYGEFVRVLEFAMPRARLPAPNKQSENVAKKMQRLKTPRYGWNCAPGSGHQFGSYGSARTYPPPISTSQVNVGRGRLASAAPTPPLTAGGTESPLSQAFPSMTDMTRQDSRKDAREWRKDSAITIDAHDQGFKL